MTLPRKARPAVRPVGEDHRATPFELFFDLVYVFAITQLTGSMARERDAGGVLRGLLMLALLWGTWSGYTWLGNHSRADGGLLRGGMVVAMAAMFVVGLTIPEAWAGGPGALVLVGAYLLVRWVHLVVFAVAADGDTGLRRQIAITWLPMTASAALLVSGTLLGSWTQVLLFAAALVVDWAGIYLTARNGHWRLRSPAHMTERHGLFLILAIGESIVAVGAGAAGRPVSVALLLAAVLGIALAVCLWWLYFDVAAEAAERGLRGVRGERQVMLAVEGYTYGHFPMIAGILLTALGVEGVVAHAGGSAPLGVFSALALHGGVALYLVGHLLFRLRMRRTLGRRRLVAACAVLAAAPLAAVLPPPVGPAVVVAVLAVLIAVESTVTPREEGP
ncbi:low temperature requirement protein A [Nonomuraea spiralis]|uniref:Low temperature requirement protein A n=1 Tax=Nonomuraea spiralis TaxID=46182 RepID=A0ABV5IUM3_9ACTN|nr:low temperature requirement protein A [Nonomuraea spiralis]GGS90113.1 low temperature requirement protein A [Nonomuraea spiralis]